MTAAALDDTDPRSKIPDTGALDRCRDDEENRAGGIAAIGAQLQSGQAQRDARGGWQRAEADRVEKPALALAQRVGLVQSLGERVEALLHGEALTEYLPPIILPAGGVHETAIQGVSDKPSGRVGTKNARCLGIGRPH